MSKIAVIVSTILEIRAIISSEKKGRKKMINNATDYFIALQFFAKEIVLIMTDGIYTPDEQLEKIQMEIEHYSELVSLLQNE